MKTGWDRIAPFYSPLMRPLDAVLLRRWRRRTAGSIPAGALTLEVGAGPGLNTPFYPAGQRVVMSDVSVAMAAIAARRATAGMSVIAADAERLPFRDGTFDAAVATLVFCSVDDDRAALRELRRAVRGGGVCAFLEHMRPQSRIGGFITDVLERVTKHYGDHVNRRTTDNIIAAGFTVDRVANAGGTLLRMIVARA